MRNEHGLAKLSVFHTDHTRIELRLRELLDIIITIGDLVTGVMVTTPMQPPPSPGGVNVWGKAMFVSVEQQFILTSSKLAPSAGRIGMLGFCRLGTIGFAVVVLAFANHVATET